MEIRRKTVVILHPHPSLARAVRGACRDEQVVSTADPRTAELRLREAPYGSVAILSTRSEGACDAVRHIKSSLPEVPALAALEGRRSGRILWDLCLAGCDEFIVLPDDVEAASIRHRIEQATRDDILDIYEETNPAGVSGRAKHLLHQASRVGMSAGFPRDLAARLHVSTATLARWFQRGGLPTPRLTLLLVRVLSAARMLQNDQRPIAEIAQAVGYSTPQAFRKAVHEVVGMSPSRLRAAGAHDTARQAVARYLRRP